MSGRDAACGQHLVMPLLILGYKTSKEIVLLLSAGITGPALTCIPSCTQLRCTVLAGSCALSIGSAVYCLTAEVSAEARGCLLGRAVSSTALSLPAVQVCNQDVLLAVCSRGHCRHRALLTGITAIPYIAGAIWEHKRESGVHHLWSKGVHWLQAQR